MHTLLISSVANRCRPRVSEQEPPQAAASHSWYRYGDVIMSAMVSQITSLTSTVYSGTAQRNHQSSASSAFVRGIHRWPVNSPHKGPVRRKIFPLDDVIMLVSSFVNRCRPHVSEQEPPQATALPSWYTTKTACLCRGTNCRWSIGGCDDCWGVLGTLWCHTIQ